MKFEEILNEDGTVKEFYSLPVKDEKFKQDIYLNTKVKEALLVCEKEKLCISI